jgi:peptidoglycan/LPS O-acetylase OafA/YrhL
VTLETGKREGVLRFAFLDGVRGLAALYVFLYHGAMVYTTLVQSARSRWPAWFAALHGVVY